MISSHTLPDMQLLFHAEIKVKSCYQKGPLGPVATCIHTNVLLAIFFHDNVIRFDVLRPLSGASIAWVLYNTVHCCHIKSLMNYLSVTMINSPNWLRTMIITANVGLLLASMLIDYCHSKIMLHVIIALQQTAIGFIKLISLHFPL